MAIPDIFKALDEEGEKECKALLEHANAQSERILDGAREEADHLRVDRLTRADRELAVVKNQRLNTARLEAKKRASAEREKLVQEVFAVARSRAESVRQRSDYEDVFERLLSEAVEGHRSEPITLHVDPRDADLLERVMTKLGIRAEMSLDLDTAGGVMVSMADGKVGRLNTVESRLAKAKRVIKSDVAAALFET